MSTSEDGQSIADTESNAPGFLRELRETGRPVVLSLGGRAKLVVRDADSYRQLVEIAERAEEIEAIRAAVAELRAGEGIPAGDVLAELRAILAEGRGG